MRVHTAYSSGDASGLIAVGLIVGVIVGLPIVIYDEFIRDESWNLQCYKDGQIVVDIAGQPEYIRYQLRGEDWYYLEETGAFQADTCRVWED